MQEQGSEGGEVNVLASLIASSPRLDFPSGVSFISVFERGLASAAHAEGLRSQPSAQSRQAEQASTKCEMLKLARTNGGGRVKSR